jgi:hypothetical protein
MKGFSVTFKRWSHDDIERGDTDDRGFIIENVSLRDAMTIGLEYREPAWSGYCEPNDSRVNCTRWLSFPQWNDCTRENLETGISEERALHFPESLSPASRARIARLFGAYGSKR